MHLREAITAKPSEGSSQHQHWGRNFGHAWKQRCSCSAVQVNSFCIYFMHENDLSVKSIWMDGYHSLTATTIARCASCAPTWPPTKRMCLAATLTTATL